MEMQETLKLLEIYYLLSYLSETLNEINAISYSFTNGSNSLLEIDNL